MADGKRLTRRLVIDQRELDILVRDTRQSGTLMGAPQKCHLGHILNYNDGSQPQYTHLRASMLVYAHINLLSMLQRFEPEDSVRVATDSIYVRKSALHKLEGVRVYVAPKRCDCGEVACDYLPLVAPAHGVTRMRSSTCPWNMQPISPSLIIRQQKRTSLPAPRRATTTRCRGTA